MFGTGFFLFFKYIYVGMFFGILFGFFSMPVLASLLELITRNFSDFPYYITNTFLFVSSQIFTVIIQTVLGQLFDYCKNPGLIILTVLVYFYLIVIFLVKHIDDKR